MWGRWTQREASGEDDWCKHEEDNSPLMLWVEMKCVVGWTEE